MAVRILHAHTSFAPCPAVDRCVRLINAFGRSAEHTLLAADPDAMVRPSLDPAVTADFPADAPSLAGLPGLARLFLLSRYMRGFDLVLSYGWPSFNAVMARHLFGGPPLIHHQEESGDPGGTLRTLYRRMALASAFRVVLGSHALQRIALADWGLGAERVDVIPLAVDVGRFRAAADNAIPGLVRRPGEVVIGAVAELHPANDLPCLIRAFAAMQTRAARLVLVGEGSDTERVMAEARRCHVADRLLMPGRLTDPARFLGCFDIFAMTARREVVPIVLIEAMAAGLPIAAMDVGDVLFAVSLDNRPLIVGEDDEAALTAALDTLSERPDLRHSIGRANREKARAAFDEKSMVVRYARLYGDAIGAPQAFLAALA